MNGYMVPAAQLSDQELCSWIENFRSQPPTMDYMAEWSWAGSLIAEANRRKLRDARDGRYYPNPVVRVAASEHFPGWSYQLYKDGMRDAVHTSGAMSPGFETNAELYAFLRENA